MSKWIIKRLTPLYNATRNGDIDFETFSEYVVSTYRNSNILHANSFILGFIIGGIIGIISFYFSLPK